MTISSRVDVVMAGDHIEGYEDVAGFLGNAVETVEVAPDSRRRIVVVARTKVLGAELAEARKIEPVAIVTPRSPQAAYGITADDIVWADDLTTEERAELEPHVLPVLATTQAPAEEGE
ncbi:hypothetical protein [Microbacterium sp. IEGM 1404]|uniref:hypothetical protein n=1 Tax=Microbacterium sp. IEGM 1404 TaxID=3047084 RepID=UPI0024B7FD0A|nr:hypothetical protein [Microbacterium sp. IEGM 1404]MDI9889960.1 hypothetical protein [Microbacterium sp. IEGM 1404]